MTDKQTGTPDNSRKPDMTVRHFRYAFAQGGEGSRIYGHDSYQYLADLAEQREREFITKHPGCVDAAKERMVKRYRSHDGD